MPPKQPATVERFRLSCECETIELGPIIAQLTKMGMTNLHFDLITDVVAFRQKTVHDVKAEDFLRSWIVDHATFAAKEAIKAFREDGRTDGAGYSAIKNMVERGDLKKVGVGNYARSDVKAIAPPKGTKAAKTSQHPTTNRYAVTHTDLILRIAKRKKGHFTTANIKDAFEKQERPRTSASPALADMVERGLIIRISEGEYQLVEPPTPPTKTNGNGTTEGVNNHG